MLIAIVISPPDGIDASTVVSQVNTAFADASTANTVLSSAGVTVTTVIAVEAEGITTVNTTATPTAAFTPNAAAADSPCFAAATTTACKILLLAATAEEAYSQCYQDTLLSDSASLVPMAALSAGDTVLAADAEGTLSLERIVVNQHKGNTRASSFIELHHSAGILTLTLDHVLVIDGSFAPSRDAMPGSTLTLAGGTLASVMHVANTFGTITNPVTASGTILAAGLTGEPVVAATHPEWSAAFMMSQKAPLPLFYALSTTFPATAQAYYEAVLEPLFDVLGHHFQPVAGDSMPDLSLLADIFVDTSSTTTFAVAVPQHLSTMPIHDRSRRMFRCASSTSMPEASEETALTLSTSEPDVDTRPLSWTEHRYIEFSRSTTSIPSYPVGQTEAKTDSVRWRVDAEHAAARLHREDLHLARVNSALFQIANDILSSSVDDVHLRAETVLRAEDRISLQPTDDADLNKLYRSMWALEVLLYKTAASPESDSEDDESESEGYDDLRAWERKRLSAIHRLFIGSDITPQMIVLPVTSDHWPTRISYTPTRVDASVPHIVPAYAGPDTSTALDRASTSW